MARVNKSKALSKSKATVEEGRADIPATSLGTATSPAHALAHRMALEFLENGNFEAVGSPMDPNAIAAAFPSATRARVEDLERCGFAGLSVQSVGYSAGAERETVHVYVTRGGKKELEKLSRERDGVFVRVTNLGKLMVKPEAAAVVGSHGNVYLRDGRIACGSSCAPAGEIYSGTLGALVRRGPDLMALSNNHVFAACNHIPVGQPILAPSSSDARPNVPAPRQVCTHANIIELRSGAPSLVPLVRADAAIASIPDDSAVSSWQGNADEGYDTPVQTMAPNSGMRVKKFGRTTGLSIGTVEALIPTPMPLPYRLRNFTAKVWFTDIWTVRADPNGHFALPGDSGSLVVTEDGNCAVGLLFAATVKGDYGYIAPIETALQDLNLQLVHGHGT